MLITRGSTGYNAFKENCGAYRSKEWLITTKHCCQDRSISILNRGLGTCQQLGQDSYNLSHKMTCFNNKRLT